MKKILLSILILSFPVLCFADSENTVGGKTAQSHIIQSTGDSLRPRPYLNFTGGIGCGDDNGKTNCSLNTAYLDSAAQLSTGWTASTGKKRK